MFFCPETNFLFGGMSSVKGVWLDPQKIVAIKEWPIPSNAKELRSFLGLAGYYRKFAEILTLLANS
jgi:hypothetical protein